MLKSVNASRLWVDLLGRKCLMIGYGCGYCRLLIPLLLLPSQHGKFTRCSLTIPLPGLLSSRDQQTLRQACVTDAPIKMPCCTRIKVWRRRLLLLWFRCHLLSAYGLVFLCFLPFHRLSSAHGLLSNTLDALDALTFLVQLSALKDAVDDGVCVDLRVWM